MSTQSTDKALREEVARDQLQAHNAAIAKGVRLSGSADEAEAFDYIAAQCEAFGLTVQRYAVDALVSLPGAASLAVAGPVARDFLSWPFTSSGLFFWQSGRQSAKIRPWTE